MSILIVTCCDYCNKDQEIHRPDGRGYAYHDAKTCIKDFGWKQTTNGIMCQDCQDEKEEGE